LLRAANPFPAVLGHGSSETPEAATVRVRQPLKRLRQRPAPPRSMESDECCSIRSALAPPKRNDEGRCDVLGFVLYVSTPAADRRGDCACDLAPCANRYRDAGAASRATRHRLQPLRSTRTPPDAEVGRRAEGHDARVLPFGRLVTLLPHAAGSAAALAS